jgi:Dolichyl-phosphate-mannose-protein mannosyltransferase
MPVAWTFGLIVLAGVIARIVQYAQRRPLYIDDVLLMLNIASRGYRDLLRPLVIEQSAPALFLWAQRFIVNVLGVSDLTFTLISFITGLAVLPMAWSFARRLVDRETSMLAVAMLALAPPLIYYATSSKQYGTDVFVAVVLAWLGLRALEAPERRSRWVAAIGGGALALTLSMPALFVLGGVWCAWALSQPIRSTVRGRMLLLVSGGLWGATFATMYVTMYSAVSHNEYMRRFWYGAYLSSQPSLWRAIRYVSKGLQVSLYDVDAGTPWLLVTALSALLIVGIVAFARERRYGVLALLTIPLLAAIAASALGLWILLARFMLFSTPFVCVLVAHGLVTIVRRLVRAPRYRDAVIIAGGLALLALPARYGLWVLRHPGNVEASARLANIYMAHAREGEPVYVYARAMPLWTYYSTDWTRPDTLRFQRLLRATIENGPGSGNGPSRGRPVRHEGFDHRFPYRGSVELIGIAPGMELTGVGKGTKPDTGWAENEAERIREVAAPTAWVAFAHYTPLPLRQLQDALKQLGGVVTVSDVRPGVALFQYRFASADSAVADRAADASRPAATTSPPR